jgi:hypothetical protein
VIGQAPRPGSFYVPGTYAPEGDRVVWRSGFWAASQPGWDWIPARWIRRSDGWEFRQGYWTRGNEGLSPGGSPAARPAADDRYIVARPAPDPSTRSGAAETPDVQPIPDEDLRRAATEPARTGPSPPAGAEQPAAQPDPDPSLEAAPDPGRPTVPTNPAVVAAAPVVIRPGLPIPYWDRGRLVVPPTRYGAGAVVDTPVLSGSGAPFPTVGMLPPLGASRVVLPDGRVVAPADPRYGPPRGPLGGMVRGILGRVRP